jgi:excinuclease ABC subunit C
LSDLKTRNILAKEGHDVKETSQQKRFNQLLEKANTLPKSSGCYFMQGKHGEVLYVGKAKNLKARVTSYFNRSAKSAKTTILVSHIYNFDFILTNSEAESLVLENNLIKKHKPKYNIQLKDDKTYPYLQVNYQDDFPKLEFVRRPKRKNKTQLYGPFPVGYNLYKVIGLLTKAFQLRDCSNYEFAQRKTPCILYQIHQCTAPCVDYVNSQQYLKQLELATNFFKSKAKVQTSMEFLTQKMMDYAKLEKFEQAAQYRDYIEELDHFIQKSFDQNVEALNDNNADIFSYYVGEHEVDISIYLIRRGNLLGHKNFHFLNADLSDDLKSEILLAMIQYYSQNVDVLPEKIISCFSKTHTEQLQDALKTIVGEGIKFKVESATKKYKPLIDSVTRHAQEKQRVRIENQDSVFVGLNRLKELLKLKDRPKSLECYDIAIWQGKSPTASQVYFYEGKPDKSGYRHYHLTELPEGNNDFAMMKEVFSRRLKHGKFPDVFIVDGGIQQVNTVTKVLEQMHLKIPVVGIAKARDLKKLGFRSSEIKNSEERLIIPGRSNPYLLHKCPALMRIMVQMRDEAHRFSRRLHHKAEKKRLIHSWVEEVKGLNAQVRKQVLQANEMELKELAQLNISDLQRYLGIEIRYARAIYEHLHTLRDS